MKVHDNLRSLVLRDRSAAKALILTPSLIKTVRMIQDTPKGITAREPSEMLGISVQGPSLRLNSLWKKGYLTREQENDTSGGIYYRYFGRQL